MKPILFNGEMVRAILDGRKTVTRRVVNQKLLDKYCDYDQYCDAVMPRNSDISCTRSFEKEFFMNRANFEVGDILYVRETFYYEEHMHELTEGEPDLPNGLYSHRFIYRASDPDYPVNVGVGKGKWTPSLHMPKEAARIFLKVTGVRVERLNDITPEQADKEGVGDLFMTEIACSDIDDGYNIPLDCEYGVAKEQFAYLWDSTIKKADLDQYGWDANPWVWVIEFEQCEKPESEGI